jgi:hypothetical protein
MTVDISAARATIRLARADLAAAEIKARDGKVSVDLAELRNLTRTIERLVDEIEDLRSERKVA